MKCFSYSCRHFSNRHPCKFYRFPKEEDKRSKWIQLIGRTDKIPTPYSRVCSCHFKNGIKRNKPTLLNEPNKSKWYEDYFEVEHDSSKRDQTKNNELIEREEETFNIIIENTIQPKPDVTYTLLVKSKTKHIDIPPNTQLSSIVEQAENYFLKKAVEELKNKVERFSIASIINQKDLLVYYTGFKTADKFNEFVSCFDNVDVGSYLKCKKIGRADQILLTLMKIRLNLGHVDLSFRFKVSVGVVSMIITTWTHIFQDLCDEGLLRKYGVHATMIKKIMTENTESNKRKKTVCHIYTDV